MSRFSKALKRARKRAGIKAIQPLKIGGALALGTLSGIPGAGALGALHEVTKPGSTGGQERAEQLAQEGKEDVANRAYLDSIIASVGSLGLSGDFVVQGLISRAQTGDQDAIQELGQRVETAKTLVEQKRLKAEGRTNLENTLQGTQGAPGTIQTAFQMAQPVLQQELARLGILQGGALTQHSEQVAKELELNRQNQLSGYDLGQLQQAQGINIDSLNSILGLRNQQRAQNLALQLGQQNSAAMRQAAQAQARAQREAAMWGAGGAIIGGSFGNKSIWG